MIRLALLLLALAGAASAQPTPIAALATTTLDGTFAGEQLGSALAHGDFNGDGRVDLALGRALAFVPDLNGDGRRELVVAAPSAEGARGEAYILFGFIGNTPAFDFDGISATAVLGDSSNRTLGWSLAGTARGLALGAALSDSGRGRVLLLPARPAPWPAIIDGAALESQGRWLIGEGAQPALRTGTALLALPADGGNAREHLVIGAPQNGQIGQGQGRVDLVPETAWPGTEEVFAHGFEDAP